VSEQIYDSNWPTYFKSAGLSPDKDPMSLRSVIKTILAALGTGGTSNFAPLTPAARGGILGTNMVQVGTRSYTHGGASGTGETTDGGRCVREPRYIFGSPVSVRLVYANFYMNNASPTEVVGANPILVRASIEDTGGAVSEFKYISASTAYSSVTSYSVSHTVTSGGLTYVSLQNANLNNAPSTSPTWWLQVQYYPVHFPGESSSRDVTIEPGQFAISLPISMVPSYSDGSFLYVNTLVQPNNGTANTGSYPPGLPTGSTGQGGCFQVSASTASVPTDYTLSAPTTAVTTNFNSSNSPYGPIALIGTPAPGSAAGATIFFSADSYHNTGDNSPLLLTDYANWMSRLLTDNPTNPTKFLYPFVMSGKGGSLAEWDQGPGFTERLTIAAGCTHYVDQKITNDIALGPLTLAQLQANALARWNSLQHLGLKVIVANCPPRTTSTDSWATANNQTPVSGFALGGIQQQYNAWLLTFPHPAVTAVIDVASVVTVLTTGGGGGAGVPVWNPSLNNADGIHPNSTGHIDIASAANMYLASAMTPVTINATSLFGTPL
jgi:hypothetical protein